MSKTFVVVSVLALLLPMSATAQPLAPVAVDIRGFTAPGYFVAAPLQQDTLVFTDEYGRALFHTRVGLHTNVLTDGQNYVTYFAGSRRSRYYVRRDAFLNPIDTFFLQGAGVADIHEGKVWSDTSMLILGVENVTMDLSNIVPGGQAEATVLVNVIQEQTFDGRVVFDWRSIDHIPVTDAVADIDLTQNYIDYLHINSVSRDLDGHLLVSCRHTDEVIKLHHQTGAVIWRLGGQSSKRNQFRFIDDSSNGYVGFSHQHTAFRTSRGTLMLFDNGNLKPTPQRTRVVEYELDELQRTARRVWQFFPPTDVFVSSMGNVQELPNGNLVIGYGSETTNVLAHEINRERGIVAELRNPTAAPINPYRVMKTTIGMTGVVDTVSVSGQYIFADADSTTGLRFDVTAVDRSVILAVERHHVLPPQVDIHGDSPQHLFPYRWSLRFLGGDSAHRLLKGSTHLSMSILPAGIDPDDVRWYCRDTVGKGHFTLVQMTYNNDSGTFRTDRILRGELIAGLRRLPEPLALSPLAQARVAPRAAIFSARVIPTVDSCELMIWPVDDSTQTKRYRTIVMQDGVAFWVVDDLSETATYRWMVRSVSQRGVSSSTTPRELTTGMAVLPRPVPSSSASMNLPVGDVTLQWTPGDPSSKILLQFYQSRRSDGLGVQFAHGSVDTIDGTRLSRTIRVTAPGSSWFWRALAIDSNGNCSPWSDSTGWCMSADIAQPGVPLSPDFTQRDIHQTAILRFSTSESYQEYTVHLGRGAFDPVPRILPASGRGEVLVSDLDPATTYYWRVVSKGSDADTGALAMFRTTATSSIRYHRETPVIVHASGDVMFHRGLDSPIQDVLLFDLLGRSEQPKWFEREGGCQIELSSVIRGWKAIRIRLANGDIHVTSLVVP